jgi:glutathionylspermidine synthase
MRRRASTPRPDWQAKCEDVGFSFHTIDGETYWDESVCYEFLPSEIDVLEEATASLHELCLKAVDHVVSTKKYERFGLHPFFIPFIEKSWEKKEPSLYGRFDLAWNGKDAPKLLEYNADTPTSLIEASVVQWFWLQDVYPKADQFNSIHEKLIARFTEIKSSLEQQPLYFSCVKENDEDFVNTEYLRDTAVQAGIETKTIFIEDIGWNQNLKSFVDLDEAPIKNIFKLYPWEWLSNEKFNQQILDTPMLWLEPAWKMLLSNKAILPILWELFPHHPNLLPSYDSLEAFKNDYLNAGYVKKPILSREGANVEIHDGLDVIATEGTYHAGRSVYQYYSPLPSFDGHYPVIGAWIIGGEPAGIGMREDQHKITGNQSHFVPHFFQG